jgi:uncharacterized membrane protein
MSMKKLAIAAAVGSLLTMGVAGTAAASDDGAKAKCYGVAKAGKNDCASASHSCAGQAKTDNDPNEWKHMSAADCTKAGGTTTAGKKPM